MSDRLALIEKMIAGGKADAFTYYARAMELRSQGRMEEALTAYAQVSADFPAYVPTYLMAGQVAVELARDEEAAAWFSRGIQAAREAGDQHALGELQAALANLG